MQNTETLLAAFFEIIQPYLAKSNLPENKVVEYLSPGELRQRMDLPVGRSGESFEQILGHISQYLKYAVDTGNRQFFNQLYGGFDLPAFMGEVVTALANTSMYTYEVAPVATLIEAEMIDKMCGIAGYENGDGIFLTGGSNANLVAMFSARNRALPEIKSSGLHRAPRLSAFISEQAHYSFETAANLLGIGSANVYKIKSSKAGKMLPDDLARQMQQSAGKGEKPFFVAATAGTTLLGAFDPIPEIGEVARRYNAWVHVDGSFGGSLILSPRMRHLFAGLENTDSFTWNPHKLMNVPLVCSAILVREKGQLQKNLTNLHDNYIYHDTDTGDFDLGKKSVQCGRRVDALKLWLAWKYYGGDGYAARMENLVEVARYFESKIEADGRFELMAPRQSLTVCFRYLPQQAGDVNAFNSSLREALRTSGKTLVNFSHLNGHFTFRWVVANAEVTEADVDAFFENFTLTAARLDVAEPFS
jgi:glutamate/tyrosine decarboxylase-like PLP-dependent enzyme